MTYSNYIKAFKQLKIKPSKLKKYIKHNAPKQRKYGIATRRCKICGRIGGHVRRYGMSLCRHCFREQAKKLGFKKY